MNKSIKRTILFVIILIGMIVSIIVAINSIQPKTKETTVIPVTQYLQLTVNGAPIVIDAFQPELWYEVPMLTTEVDTEISIGEFTGYEITINNQPIQSGGDINIRLKELKKSTPITIAIKNLNNNVITNYYVRTLAGTVPDLITRGQGIGDEYYYFAPINSNYILKMNTKGEIVFYKALSGPATNFKCDIINNKVRYSYLEKVRYPENPPLDSVGYFQMKAVVMDEHYKVIDEVPYMIANETIPENHPLENHDFNIIEDGHYIISGYVGKKVNNIPENVPHSEFGTNVVACIIQEIKNGELIWQWDSTEHEELYAMSIEGNDYFNDVLAWADYAHFNSFYIDPKDNNLICSFRNLSSVIKINRETGEIMWVLGGKGDQFGLTEEQKFSRQHYAVITENGSLTLFDNGNIDPTLGYPVKDELDDSSKKVGVSRILEFELDEENKKIINYKANKINKAWSIAMGSAQKLLPDKNIYVVGWGSRMTKQPLFSEIDFDSKKVLFEVFDERIDQSGGTYRVFKSKK